MQLGNNVPDREQMRRIYDLRAAGYTASMISATVGRPVGTINWYLSRPDRFDPYLDEVALKRALAGERKVFEHLTVFELDEFYRRIERRLEVEPYDDKIHASEFGTKKSRGTRSTFWLHDLEQLLGLSRGRMARALRRRHQAREAAEAA